MSYSLGIDVGTSFTAAAVCRRSGAGVWGEPEVVPLGVRSAAVASVVFFGADGQVVVGDGAERRALSDPDRVVREFKRRVGDEVPLVVGGQPRSAHAVAARMVRWVCDRVVEREGGSPQAVTVTHPASWGPHRKTLLAQALDDAQVPEVRFRSEPEAAAISYAAQERVETGATIAVYDLGGGTFDAAVVRKTGPQEFTVLGTPQGIERLGGVDFDEAVFGHVRDHLGGWGELDVADPAVLAAMARLRRECTEAKEALSADTEVTIPVLLPGRHTQLRLVRSEFETMITPAIADTIGALRAAMASAEVTEQDLDAVLLVGGSSRIPLVAQQVSAELGRPTAIDTDPTTAIATGAALPDTHHHATAATTDLATPLTTDGRDGLTVVLAGADLTDQEADADGGAELDPDLSARPAPEPVLQPQRPVLHEAPLGLETAERTAHFPVRKLQSLAAAGILAFLLLGTAAAVPFVMSETSNTATGELPAAAENVAPAPAGLLPAPALGNSKASPRSSNGSRDLSSSSRVGSADSASTLTEPVRRGTSGGRGGGPGAVSTRTGPMPFASGGGNSPRVPVNSPSSNTEPDPISSTTQPTTPPSSNTEPDPMSSTTQPTTPQNEEPDSVFPSGGSK